jgi:hypothetical protein
VRTRPRKHLCADGYENFWVEEEARWIVLPAGTARALRAKRAWAKRRIAAEIDRIEREVNRHALWMAAEEKAEEEEP